MNSKFASAFFKMGALGHNPNSVSIVDHYIVQNSADHGLAQLTDCSFIIPEPPALNDVIEFPPQQFLSDIQQSVSSRFSFPLKPGNQPQMVYVVRWNTIP